MLTSFVLGATIIILLMIIWVFIQFGWKKIFSEHISDEDVLAERRSCSNCGCTTICEKKISTNKDN